MKTYEELVALGREIVSQVNDRQMRICGYAIQVCTIRHGGRSNGYYTMKDYARDIGLNNKTLNQWMLVYRNVVLKLSATQLETMTWKMASRVNEQLEEANTIENRIKGTPRSKMNTKKFVTTERVQKLYDDAVEEKPFVGEFMAIMKQTKHCHSLLLKRDLSLIQDSHLNHLMQMLDNCSDMINDHLTQKKKAKVA